MKDNKQTGLTHLHVYTLVIYRMERETVACIVITACRSPRKDTEQQFSRFSVNNELKRDKSMVQNAAQPFGRNPQEPILSNSKKIGLLVGLLFGEKEKFYIDSLKTGVGKRSLSTLLMSSPRIKNATSTADMLRFLHDEGDRTSYSILLPLLLTAHTKEELAKSIRERFFGIELFVEKGIRLYDFILAMQTENDLFIGEKEVKQGLLGWDMGRLVCLARIASDSGTISNDTAWKFIESAGEQCQARFGSWEELGKSILIGQAMESAEQEDLKDMIRIFRQAMNSENSPWNHFSLSTT